MEPPTYTITISESFESIEAMARALENLAMKIRQGAVSGFQPTEFLITKTPPNESQQP